MTSVFEEIALGFGKTDKYKETTGIPALSSFESERACLEDHLSDNKRSKRTCGSREVNPAASFSPAVELTSSRICSATGSTTQQVTPLEL